MRRVQVVAAAGRDGVVLHRVADDAPFVEDRITGQRHGVLCTVVERGIVFPVVK